MVVTMVSHICLFAELGPICNSMAALLYLKSFWDHRLLKSYDGGLWKNTYRSGPINKQKAVSQTIVRIITTHYLALEYLMTPFISSPNFTAMISVDTIFLFFQYLERRFQSKAAKLTGTFIMIIQQVGAYSLFAQF